MGDYRRNRKTGGIFKTGGPIKLGTAPVKWPKTGIASKSTRPFSGFDLRCPLCIGEVCDNCPHCQHHASTMPKICPNCGHEYDRHLDSGTCGVCHRRCGNFGGRSHSGHGPGCGCGDMRPHSGEGLIPTKGTIAKGFNPFSRSRSGLFANERGQRILGRERIATGEKFSPGFKARGITRGKVVPRDAPGKITGSKKIIDKPKPIWPRGRSGDASARGYWSEGKDYNWSKGSLGPWRGRSGVSGPIVKFPKTGIASKKRTAF